MSTRNTRLKFVLLLPLVFACTDGSAWAQSKVGTTVGAFLRIEPTARVAGMGNAGSALPGGLEAVYFNPGAIGTIEQAAVSYTHSFWLADISYNYAALALPVKGVGNFFASVTSLNSGEMDVRTVEQPLGTGERFDVSNVAVGLGYGLRVTSRFATGVQVNFGTERIWHTSNRLVTFSVGTVYKLNEQGMTLGFGLMNFGTSASYTGGDLSIQYDPTPDVAGDNGALPADQATDAFPVPVMFRIGLSLPLKTSEDSRFLALVEALHPNDNSESANVGLEWEWKSLFALRAGYQTLFQTDGQLGLTLGFGIKGDLGNNTYQLDYAWAEHESLEDTQRVSMAINF
jgi:hypothetical protein